MFIMDLELITKALEATVSPGMKGHVECGPIFYIVEDNFIDTAKSCLA